MKIVFDMIDCSRCGGNGKMPFANYGGVCFKCNGKGRMMSPNGKRAWRKMLEVQKEICSIPASSLKVGDKIMDSQKKPRVVQEIKVSLGKGRVSSPDWDQYGEAVVVCKGYSMSMAAHADVLKAWDSESLAVCADRLKNFKGAKVVA